MRRSLRWPRVLAPPAIVAGSLVVLLSAVILGASITGLRLFPPFGGRTQLGGELDGGIAPLTDRFVDQVLGPGEKSLGLELDRVGSVRQGPRDSGEEPGGVVVEHPFTNDTQSDAYRIERLPFTGRTKTAEAKREDGDPECGPALGGTAWYRYTATRTEALVADTFETDHRTSLAAFRQFSGELQQMEHGCDFDALGNSQVRLDVKSGMTYLFQIGAATQGGDLTFHLKRFGSTIVASVSTAGKIGNASSAEPSVSKGGRYVAFSSQSTNLAPNMQPRSCPGRRPTSLEEACFNVFLRDRQAGTTALVSVGLDGMAADNSSRYPEVSDDGRYVLFHSASSDLVAGDTNGLWDAFVRDMHTGRTERVSVGDREEQLRLGLPASSADPMAAGPTGGPIGVWRSSMSADGRYVVFQSRSSNVAKGDTDEVSDIFVRDRRQGTTRLASLGDRRHRSPVGVSLQSVSRNGRWVVVVSEDPLSGQDGDRSRDVFAHDLWTGATDLISVPEPGHELEGIRGAEITEFVSQRSISDDGRFVAFGSLEALVDADTNGVLDVFVRDRLRRVTERVTVASSGGEGRAGGSGGYGEGPTNQHWSISGDGRTVAFTTELAYLEPDDGNNVADVFVHDRAHKVTLRVSTSGNAYLGSFSPQISGDGMRIAFSSEYPLSRRDANGVEDVFVFSPLPAVEEAVSLRKVSVPTAPCAPSSEYARLGLGGAHEDFMPALVPSVPDAVIARDDYAYEAHSVVQFKYRIDLSGSSANPFPQIADVEFELRWNDGESDYDFAVYDAKGEFLVASRGGLLNLNNFDLTNGDFSGVETGILSPVPHCMDLRVDVVNYLGLPLEEITLDVTLGGLA